MGTLREAINQGTTLAVEIPTPGNLKSGVSLLGRDEGDSLGG